MVGDEKPANAHLGSFQSPGPSGRMDGLRSYEELTKAYDRFHLSMSRTWACEVGFPEARREAEIFKRVWFYYYVEQISAKLILSEMEGQRVIDLGCWTGCMSMELSRAGCEVTSVDADPRAVSLTARLCRAVGGEVRPVQSEMDDLRQIPDESFDFGCAVNLPWSCNNVEPMLSRLCRKLKPGGKAMIVVAKSNVGAFVWRAFRLVRAESSFLPVYSPRSFQAALIGAGFRVVSIVEGDRRAPVLRSLGVTKFCTPLKTLTAWVQRE